MPSTRSLIKTAFCWLLRACGRTMKLFKVEPTGRRRTLLLNSGGSRAPYLRVVSHDVVEASQETQAGTYLHVHGSIDVVEEVQRFVDQLTALLQEPWGGGGPAA